jgi:UDP-glucose 4-epimerase
MKTLVTGGTGLLGSALVSNLTADGVDTVVWDRRVGTPVQNATYQIKDLEHPVEAVDERFECVFHLAGRTENVPGKSSFVDEAASIAQLANVCQALRKHPPQALVLASSQLVYGEHSAPSEREPVCPTSRFGAGKAAAELVLAAIGAELGMRTIACRLSNVVGPDMRRGIIPDLVQRAKRSEAGEALTVLGDGRQRRAFLHVDDCARALRVVAECSTWTEINVANATAVSALRIAELVAEQTSPKRAVRTAREGDIRGWATDPGTVLPVTVRLESLGWSPALTAEEAVRMVVEAQWRGKRL